jgi:polar amino acid transport system substrate-binding protein
MHVVVAGDSLSKIAMRYYGNAEKWTRIYDVPKNKAAIGPNPSAIRAGLQLEIP